MLTPQDVERMRVGCEREADRFRSFLESHAEKRLDLDGKSIPYLSCGTGPRAILTFAGGWGGTDLVYDFVLATEDRHRVLVVDISGFDDPEEMTRGIDSVLNRENIDRPVVFGQSFSGIIAQIYFRRRFNRAQGLILVNTLAPRPKRSKRWALALVKALPFGGLKLIARKKITRLSELKKEIPEDVRERRLFVSRLFGRMIDTYWTRTGFLNVLKLAFAFNEQGFPPADSFAGWTGKVLVVTAEDEPYLPDVGLLTASYLHAETHMFPAGYGHLAPQIFRDEFFGIVRGFIGRLE